MKSIQFKESRVVYAKDNPVYEAYAYRDESPKGQKDIVLCYDVGFWERLMLLITGKIWVNITTLDGNMRPMRMSVLKRDMITTRKQRKDKEKIERKMKKILPTPPKKKLHIPPPGENGMSVVK